MDEVVSSIRKRIIAVILEVIMQLNLCVIPWGVRGSYSSLCKVMIIPTTYILESRFQLKIYERRYL